jgi:hypothetical protein
MSKTDSNNQASDTIRIVSDNDLQTIALPVVNMAADSNAVFSAHETQATAHENFPNIARSAKFDEINAMFLIFLSCLLIFSFTFTNGRQLITSIFNTIFSPKPRQNMFKETTSRDFFNELLLMIQSVIISSVLIFATVSHERDIIELPVNRVLNCIGCFFLLITVYLFYKRTAYAVMSYVFFDQSRGSFWMEHWSSLLIISGLLIFLPVVVLYFIPSIYYFSFYVILLWFLVTRIIIVYKSYRIFFNGINRLHYFFLYLCAQEIIPLFLLYKGLIYTFDFVVEKGILWI